MTLPKNGTDLLITLNKYSIPWQRLDIVERTLQEFGTQAFVQLLGIPEKGILSRWQARHDPLFRTLAILAFSHIKVLKEKEEIASLKTDFSKNLLFILQQEATGGATQLIRWSAAKTINCIWFDEEWLRQNKPYYVNAQFNINNTRIDRIEKQITEQEVEKLSRLQNKDRYSNTDRLEFSEDYQKYLEFWVYGPSSVLFELPSKSDKYDDLIKDEYSSLIQDVLDQLEPRGIKLGIDSRVTDHIERSLKLAKTLFKKTIVNNPYYGPNYYQVEISHCLGQFLKIDTGMQISQSQAIYFRKLAAQSLFELDSKLWKNDDAIKYRKARAAVILKEWEVVKELGEASVSSLKQVIQGALQLEVEQDLKLDVRVKAVGTIGEIKFKDDQKKIKALCEFLLVPEQRIREESALLLKQYLGQLEPKWRTIVKALLYQFNDLPSLDAIDIKEIKEIKEIISKAESDKKDINSIFKNASRYCEENASEVKYFFNQKQNEYEKNINAYLEKLNKKIPEIKYRQDLVQKNAQRILDTLKKRNKERKLVLPNFKNQLRLWEKKAQDIKDTPLSSYSFNKALEFEKEVDKLKWEISSEESSIWWRNFTIKLALLTLVSFSLSLLIYFPAILLFFVVCLVILLVPLRKQIPQTLLKIKQKLAEANSQLTEAKKD